MSDFLEWDASAQLAAMRAGRLSAERLMAATLERINAVNGSVNAIVGMAQESALMELARAADQQPARGVFHGMPMAVKDLEPVAGFRYTDGSPLFADRVADADGLVAGRLRASGALFVGKTNVPEFGLGSHSYNPVYGVTANPYDALVSAGGSSGGAGAALATRMLSVADGSDMMGSLRNPAAWNNVYGFRPSWGVVPKNAGGEVFLAQLSTLGPMARSPADLALMMGVIAGPNPLVPHNVPDQTWDLPATSLAGKRIGWLGDWGGAWQIEPGILEVCEAGLSVFEAAGAEIVKLDPPFDAEEIFQSWATLRSWSLAGDFADGYSDPTVRARLKPEAVWEIERGLGYGALDVTRASQVRSDWFTVAARLLSEFDALVLPGAQVWPFPIEWDWPKDINGVAMDSYHRWMEVMPPAGLLGLPVVGMPVGFSDRGLPMGIQLIGPKFGDRDLLALAQAYHEATFWPQRHPPVMTT